MMKTNVKVLWALMTVIMLGMVTGCKYHDTVSPGGSVEYGDLNIDVSNYVLSGIVYNQKTMKPIPGAELRLKRVDDSETVVATTVTEANGAYQFQIIDKADYVLVVSARGYFESEENISFPENTHMYAKYIYLQPDGTEEPEDTTVVEKIDFFDNTMMEIDDEGFFSGTLRTKYTGNNIMASIPVKLCMSDGNIDNWLVDSLGNRTHGAILSVRTIYSENEVPNLFYNYVDTVETEKTRAGEMTQHESMAFGVHVLCSEAGAEIVDPKAKLVFYFGAELSSYARIKRYNSGTGKWDEIPSRVVDGEKVEVMVDRLGYYALFLDYSLSGAQELPSEEVFRILRTNRSMAPIYLEDAPYLYKMGTGYSPTYGRTPTEALLLELLYRKYGVGTVEFPGVYEFKELCIAPGFGIFVIGYQNNKVQSLYSHGIVLTMTHYGSIVVTKQGGTADHWGGSN